MNKLHVLRRYIFTFLNLHIITVPISIKRVYYILTVYLCQYSIMLYGIKYSNKSRIIVT